MNRFKLRLLGTSAFAVGMSLYAVADDAQYINILNEDGSYNSLNLQSYNRITFDENGVIFSDKNGVVQTQTILYEAFKSLSFGDLASHVDELKLESSAMCYDAASQTLTINNLTKEAIIGIFNSNGVLVKAENVMGGESINLANLQHGIYIVIITDKQGTNNQYIKIIR